MSNLEEAVKKLGESIKDLSELRVQTVTGDVKAVIDAKNLQSLKDLLDPGKGNAKSQAKLNLVLDTTIAFDGDALNFIDTALATHELTQLHKEAITAGLNQRKAIVEMFRGVIS